MLKAAKRSLTISRNKYEYEATDNEIIVFSKVPVLEIKRINENYDTSMYDTDGKVIHPTVSLIENDENYQDYRYSDLIYKVQTQGKAKTLEINIPYAHSLSEIQAKYSKVFVWSANQWQQLETEYDKTAKLLRAVVGEGINSHTSNEVIVAVFSNYFWYSTYTKRMAQDFPEWSYVYKNKNSNGQRFLNFFGIEFEELEEHMSWIRDQKYIGTADITQIDWLYLYTDTTKKLDVTDNVYYMDGQTKKEIQVFETVQEFSFSSKNDGVIFDYEKGLIYSQYEYDKIIVEKSDGESFELTPRLHQVWNIYDEFGLLLGVKRIFGEKNYRFIERILDVFRYPSNTSEMGLTHGIARDLGLIQRYTLDNNGNEIEIEWKDDTKPLLIKNKSGMFLDHRTLRVDGKRLIYGSQYTVDMNNNILINPLEEYTYHHISIVQGIEKYELHDKKNQELYNMMYKENGLATPLFESWVSYIRKIAPVMWDDFQWDKGYWDTIDKELTGIGYVPNHWDSNMENWKGVYIDE